MAESANEATNLVSSSPADVIVLDGTLDEARDLIPSLKEMAPSAAIVWVGPNPPDTAHASIEEVSDALEGAITRGLLAARAAK
ncbi:MAG TPA: hypothetical protein VJ891_11245 [Casimicrobiaceae bacterium]|nr:hypothetical protein [Casimicrobiaceae bacterium]